MRRSPVRATPAPSILLALFLPVLAAACASEPYEVTAPPVPLWKYAVGTAASGPGSKTAPPRSIAICYNGAFSEPAEVLAQVREICPKKGEIIRVDEDVFWNNCSLSKPVRATFICIPGPAKPSKFN